MSNPEKGAEPSLLKRIAMSDRTLHASLQEFSNELAHLAATQNREGAVMLSIALYQWEMRNPNREPTLQLHRRTMENLDTAARLADCLQITQGDIKSAMFMSNAAPAEAFGTVTKFFREATGYTPRIAVRRAGYLSSWKNLN